MSDPRLTPGFKQKHYQDKVILLLGAILDALTKPASVPLPNVRKTAKPE